MIELFLSNGAVAWRHFDDFGALVDEGIVSEAPDATDRDAKSQLRSIWTELLTARFEIDIVGDAICVKAPPHDVERATARRLGPYADSKVLL